jgi:predicted RNA-binding protein
MAGSESNQSNKGKEIMGDAKETRYTVLKAGLNELGRFEGTVEAMLDSGLNLHGAPLIAGDTIYQVMTGEVRAIDVDHEILTVVHTTKGR